MSASAAPTGPQRRSLLGWLIPVLGLLIAFGLAYGVYDTVQEHRAMARTGVAVEGRMTGGYRQVTSGRARTTSYYPTFSYRTPDGWIIIGTVSDAVEQSEIRPGTTRALRYDPQDPHKVRLASALEEGPGALPWVIGGLALILAAISLVPLLKGRRVRV